MSGLLIEESKVVKDRHVIWIFLGIEFEMINGLVDFVFLRIAVSQIEMCLIKLGFKFDGFYIVLDSRVEFALFLVDFTQCQLCVRGVRNELKHLVVIADGVFISMCMVKNVPEKF